jgi:hypothetical protein
VLRAVIALVRDDERSRVLSRTHFINSKSSWQRLESRNPRLLDDYLAAIGGAP